jgi:hypothetical protein
MSVDVTEPTAADLMREVNMLRARVDFPLADQDILQLISGTPDQIRSAAQKLHQQALAAQPAPTPAPAPAPAPSAGVPAPAPAQPQPTPQLAPGPAPVPGPGQGEPPEAVADARYNDLLYKVENRIAEPHERQEFFMSTLKNGWNSQVEQMNARHGK